jgi:hypothetical protein
MIMAFWLVILFTQVFGQDDDRLPVDLALDLIGIIRYKPDVLDDSAHFCAQGAAFDIE